MKLDTAARAVLVALAGLAIPCQAATQGYPAKPIRLISPYPAGGPNDTIARIIAPKIAEQLGQQVIVDNRGGAAGALGADLTAKAPRDGYTLLLGQAGNLAINVSLSKLPYDPAADFAPISLVGKGCECDGRASVRNRALREAVGIRRHGETRRAQLLVRRQRRHGTPEHRALHAHCRNQHGAHSIQGRCRGFEQRHER